MTCSHIKKTRHGHTKNVKHQRHTSLSRSHWPHGTLDRRSLKYCSHSAFFDTSSDTPFSLNHVTKSCTPGWTSFGTPCSHTAFSIRCYIAQPRDIQPRGRIIHHSFGTLCLHKAFSTCWCFKSCHESKPMIFVPGMAQKWTIANGMPQKTEPYRPAEIQGGTMTRTGKADTSQACRLTYDSN